jgi:2'-hydroxyisoflavone reductase
MRLLIIGGSRFLGRAVAVEALAAGHEVTVFNRGRSGPDVGGVEAVRGDRESVKDLARLTEGREWDAVIDTCGYVPAVVRRSVRALAGNAECYLFMSTCSVFSDWPARPVSDDSPTYDCSPDAGRDGDDGTLKVGCERVVERDFPGRTLALRLGLLLGPHEDVGRLPAWLLRVADAGEHRDLRVLAPGDPDRPMRVLDARDAAVFALDAIDRGLQGAYVVNSPEANTTYGEWLGYCIEATGSRAELVWVDDDFLIDRKVGYWADLPLWAPPGDPEVAGIWDVAAPRAEAAGLRCRPVKETVFDTWAWLAADGGRVRRRFEPSAPHGLEEERERALLAAWDARG